MAMRWQNLRHDGC